MRFEEITEKNVMLLRLADDRNGAVEREQTIYSQLAFYNAVDSLKKKGLIEDCGYSRSRNNRKIWRITQKGIRLLELIDEIERMW